MSARNSRRGKRAGPHGPRDASLPQRQAREQPRLPEAPSTAPGKTDSSHAGALPAQDRSRSVTHEVVTAARAGQRVDNFLMRLLTGVPKSHVYSLLRSGQVRVNGGRVKPARRLAEGENVRIPPVRVAAREGQQKRPPDALVKRLKQAVIHEDAHYLALTKPAGLAVHGGSGLDFGVIEILRSMHGKGFLELAHRLDRDTSGVLLLAKSRPALLRAQSAFRERQATKRYFALLCGGLSGPRDVDAPLLRQQLAGGERFVTVDPQGRAAQTRFVPSERFDDATLCEVSIFSGRTHQIRVHAEFIGQPVAGDRKYGTREQHAALRKQGLKRLFLHAHYLELPAAEGFDALIVNAPLPDALREFLIGLPR